MPTETSAARNERNYGIYTGKNKWQIREEVGDEEFKNTAENFIVSVIKEIVPLQYNFEFWIEDTRLYPSSPTQQHINSKEKTKILLPSKAITYGILDNELFGPYEIEVLIWE